MRHILHFLFLFMLISFHAKSQVRIEEAAIFNLGTFTDEDGDAEDWIELRNMTASPVNLAGYMLSDNLNLPQKWIMPNVTIPANGFLIVFASGKDRSGPVLHTNFSISPGEVITLYHPSAGLLSSLVLPNVPHPYTYGRENNGNPAILTPASPGAPNPTNGYWGILGAPGFQTTGGYYSNPVQVSIGHYDTSSIIRYTTDGSEPTLLSPVYTGPITLGFTNGQANRWSTIPSNPSLNYPQGSYDSLRAQTRGWVPPYGNVFKAHVIRTRAFPTYPGALPSESSTRTFIIDPLANNRFTLPVVSLVSDSTGLFGPEDGIYIYGNAIDGNYNELGDLWERKAHLELYSANGDHEFSLYLGIRTHGGGGRHSTQKSLKLNLRNAYGTDQLNHLVFPMKTQNKFNDLILRGPGHRPDCIPRDDLSGMLVEGLPFDYMHLRPVIVLLNGEYWGIHTIKENMNADYFSNKYSIPKDEITILDKEGDVEEGDPADEFVYQAMEDFINTADMTIPANYAWVRTQMDIDNYINYQLAEIYFGNGDWPNSNIRMWRKFTGANSNVPNGHDGKWRWIFFDLDGGYGGTCNNVFPGMNGLQQATLTTPLFNSYTRVLRGLLNNPDFKAQFILRYCDLLNTWFRENRVRSVIQKADQVYRPEILEHTERWRYPSMSVTLADRYTEIPGMQAWDRIIYRLDSFASRRPTVQRTQLINFFTLSDSVRVTLNVNDTLMGRIKINSILIHPQLPGVQGPTYPWKGLYIENIPMKLTAIPLPGYQFVEWLGTGITTNEITVSLNPDTTFTALFAPDPTYNPAFGIRFNEVMAMNNSVIQDEFSQYDDWFELFNYSSDTVDLNGYFISRTLSQPTQFQILSGIQTTKIAPFGFKLVWADNQPVQGNFHTNFNLPASGGSLYLFAPDGITLVDSINYAAMVSDVSFGRYPDGAPEFVWFNYTTPNMSNAMTAIEELNQSMQLIPYPNPNGDEILYLNRPGNFTVYDINGKWMGDFSNASQITLSGYPKGMYLIRDDKGNSARFIRM
ncbi:MAG TPA: CotH kinase family protein [Flavobacteriales bacterium]|nr:CotH kinase family protein [Flavobacteriales bacterium]HRE98347.1 CotH kinase family protein [Flavobacteriales bacterium]HRJ36129.1 CotH kinase family protein [Flavobacteriales bacterium]